ncbi:hypothetical protein [Methylocystis hirsuta]|uniref:Uncharacterized protein n=1 Tax=Methylocystis hirsuta TaxID=369798 RepID=A0A3M9XKU1_9HYPH|nr:hypothetical protein [Methylocystis hirsuta]RNJ48396.1 hypothetical protein D1O30_00900 [Methylocystis hirsuta]
MTDNDDGADRRLSRRALLLGAFTLPLVVLEPEPASAQLGLIGAMLGGFRFRRRHYGGYHHYHARPHYARHRGRVHVANRHRHGGGGGGGGSGGGGQFSKGGL